MNPKYLSATWRSYKTFLALGSEKKHSTTAYMQLQTAADGKLSMCQLPDSASINHCELTSTNNRYYFCIRGKQVYEVITLDALDLVLLDIARQEKIFFAPLSDWSRRMQPPAHPVASVSYITIWSKSLTRLIRQL
jgi:hypothetical protein